MMSNMYLCSSGFMNDVYHVSLPKNNLALNGAPSDVVIKCFNEKHMFGNPEEKGHLGDFMTSIIAGKQKLAPNVLGCFPGGRIDEHIQVRMLSRTLDQFFPN